MGPREGLGKEGLGNGVVNVTLEFRRSSS